MTFLTDALAGASAMLTTAGQQSVTWGSEGITVTDLDSPCNSIRMIGGAILLSKQDSNGQLKWTTGITYDGVSASLITAGVLNAGEIQIMICDEPCFRWESFGLTAFNFTSHQGVVIAGSVEPNHFVRLDKFGLYGIDGTANGLSWHPNSVDNILEKATFAITWDGLRIKKVGEIQVDIGYKNGNVINIISDSSEYKKRDKTIFSIDKIGNARFAGELIAATGHFVGSISVGSLTETSEDVPTGVPQDPVFSVNSDGIMRMRRGGIYLGDPLEKNKSGYSDTNDNFDTYNYPFSVNDSGVLRAVSGHIGGWTLNQNGLYYEESKDNLYTGMLLSPKGSSLSNFWDADNSKTISITNAVFSVYSGQKKDKNKVIANVVITAGGELYATGAYISGTIYSTNGEIAGLRISETALRKYQGNTLLYHLGDGLEEGSGDSKLNIALKINTGFKVTSGGTLYATGAHIDGSGTFTGTIEATGGHIGSWSIGTGLSNGTVFLHPVGATGQVSGFTQQNYVFKAGTGFGVTAGGVLHASGAVIQGNSTFMGNGEFTGYVKATSGEIGGCSIVKGKLKVAAANITSIDASTITTGTLSANLIKGGTLSGCSINIGGTSASNSAFGVSSAGTVYFGSASYDQNIYVYGHGGSNSGGEPWTGQHKCPTFHMALMQDTDLAVLIDYITLYFIKGLCVGWRGGAY